MLRVEKKNILTSYARVMCTKSDVTIVKDFFEKSSLLDDQLLSSAAKG